MTNKSYEAKNDFFSFCGDDILRFPRVSSLFIFYIFLSGMTKESNAWQIPGSRHSKRRKILEDITVTKKQSRRWWVNMNALFHFCGKYSHSA